ncbi:MAG: NAD-dependent malic enzyme, partial [Oscillospiraceae bacterium]|nr:NAD-dependent malic enzyme [Oscillospiraceae bacterium]
TPGVAQPCLEIEKDPALSYKLTRRGNLVAVISDGTAVLGLGDIGPEAAMPVMEGKCVLFKEFAGVDAVPLCLDSKDTNELCRAIEMLAPSFGGINLEDIAAPRCFEIERRLKEKLSIPVFHDDQHGTAVVVSAALLNGLKLAGKTFADSVVVINGAGAAGIAIAKHLISFGAGDVILCDKEGIVYDGHPANNEVQQAMTAVTNKRGLRGSLADAVKGADIFVGVSRPDMLTAEMVATMAEKSIVFAMANPTPEIMPDEAKRGGAFIVGTGRSDYPNQVNNVLAFPGIFKGALMAGATDITEGMKRAASLAIAGVLSDDELSTDCVLPGPFDPRVADAVAKAVAEAAAAEGVVRK